MNGSPVRGLCVQLQTSRPAHMVTAGNGSHELETTLRYFEELNDPENANYAPHRSPFRPSKLGPYPIRSVEITDREVIVRCTVGMIRLPAEMTVYSVTD